MKSSFVAFSSTLVGIFLLFFLSACQPQQIPDAAEAPAAEADDEALIFFTSNRDNIDKTYSMRPDGSNVQEINLGPLPANVTNPSRPVWSPVLEKYFFQALVDRVGEVFSVDADGTNLVNLTNTPGIYEGTPVLSPDSKHLAFIAVEVEPKIYVMEPNGKNLVNITPFSGTNEAIHWAPDSSRLYFSSNKEATPNIYSANVDGSDLKNISKGIGLDVTPTISPDGSKVVFASDRDGAMDIFAIDVASGEIVNLTQHEARDTNPLYSPDGQKIVFRSDRDGQMAYFVMNADGSSQEKLSIPDNMLVNNVGWMPDSQSLLVDAEVDGQYDIFRLPLDGSTPVNLTNHPASDYAPVWVPLK